MQVIKYAVTERDSDFLEQLKELDGVALELDDTLEQGYRLADRTLFLYLDARSFLESLVDPQWLASLKSQKRGVGPLIIVSDSDVYAVSASLDYQQRVAAIAQLMVDQEVVFITVADSPDGVELLSAFVKISSLQLGVNQQSGRGKDSQGVAVRQPQKITAAMLYWVSWLSGGGVIQRTSSSVPEAVRGAKKITWEMVCKLEDAKLVTWGPLLPSGKYQILRCGLMLTEKGRELAVQARHQGVSP